MPTTVLLDLDGTLTDSAPGIYAGAAYALKALGRPTEPGDLPAAIIGPPIYECFREILGLSDADARRGISLYREYYGEKGLFENIVYDGIPALLSALKEKGYRLALATGKPWPYAERILAHFGLDVYFDAVFGAEFDGTRGKKADLIAYALDTLGITPGDALMIGDRRFDVEGALAVGVTPLGVLWGYGDREELSAAGATLLAATPREALDIIVSLG